jgi:hypothetical protein
MKKEPVGIINSAIPKSEGDPVFKYQKQAMTQANANTIHWKNRRRKRALPNSPLHRHAIIAWQ